MGTNGRGSNSTRYYTPTQQRIIDLLQDGLPHLRIELMKCLGDDLTTVATLHSHFVKLRKKLVPRGETIVCEILNRRIAYRHVRLLSSNS